MGRFELAHKTFDLQSTPLKLLDCFCGMGGVSDGFALEGFDVTGIDIVDAPKMLGYKHKFIQADMLTLKGEDFRGFDVVWGSPPCRDFSPFGRCYGKKWKNPPNPQKGKLLIKAYLCFIEEAKPTFWIMENVHNLTKYIDLKPQIECYIRKKKHGFWGNFPQFLFGQIQGTSLTFRKGKYPEPKNQNRKLQPWIHAKIPLACSRAFSKACKDALMSKIEVGV